MNQTPPPTIILGGGFDDALTLKLRVQDCLATACQTRDPEQRSHLLTVAIIGAGPAGVVVCQWSTSSKNNPVFSNEVRCRGRRC